MRLALVVLVAACAVEPASRSSDLAAPASQDAAVDRAADASNGTDAGNGTDASSGTDAGSSDANTGAAVDLGSYCAVSGAPGECILVSACAALGDHTSYAGYCPGPANIRCCIITPSVAGNPPIPAGYKPMMQAEVTPDMTTWAVAILHDPVTYPMFATTTKTFGSLTVLARVEWHPPDFQNSIVHRGVTLYEPK